MLLANPKKLDKVHNALVNVGYEYDPDNFTVEALLKAVEGTTRYETVNQFFNNRKDAFLEHIFNQISMMIYRAQTTPEVELEEFAILNKISEHAIVALRERDKDWLLRIRKVVSNGMKEFKAQVAKRKENDFRGTV
jgi:hypothetical protein